MTLEEFWQRVEDSLRENKSLLQREGVGWFISDMETLFEEWEDGG